MGRIVRAALALTGRRSRAQGQDPSPSGDSRQWTVGTGRLAPHLTSPPPHRRARNMAGSSIEVQCSAVQCSAARRGAGELWNGRRVGWRVACFTTYLGIVIAVCVL